MSDHTTAPPVRFLRRRQVLERVGATKATLYRWIRGGHFPPGVTIGPRMVGWVESEVDAWCASRVASRPAQPK